MRIYCSMHAKKVKSFVLCCPYLLHTRTQTYCSIYIQKTNYLHQWNFGKKTKRFKHHKRSTRNIGGAITKAIPPAQQPISTEARQQLHVNKDKQTPMVCHTRPWHFIINITNKYTTVTFKITQDISVLVPCFLHQMLLCKPLTHEWVHRSSSVNNWM